MSAAASIDRALSIRGVAKSFAGVKALDGVDLTIGAGVIVGVLGPNGSGKTTLVNCLSGVLRPSSGEIRLGSRDITRLSTRRRARDGIVRTFQNLRLFPTLTAAENVAIGLARLGRVGRLDGLARIRRALAKQDLLGIADRRVAELPYGIQRRVEIARALIGAPAVLLLDEPGAGLGTVECAMLTEALSAARREHGCAILLIDHNVPFVAALADRLVLLAGGRVIRDAAPAALLADPIVAEIYLGKAVGHA